MIHASAVGDDDNKSHAGLYRCTKCGQPKKGHVCTADVLEPDESRAPLSASPVESEYEQDTPHDSKRRRICASEWLQEAALDVAAEARLPIEAVELGAAAEPEAF